MLLAKLPRRLDRTTAWSEAKVVLAHDVVGGVVVVLWDVPGLAGDVECEGEAGTGATRTLHDCTR